jgi:S-adenosylmethionine:tRNA ribosyltransferase-isomerase
MAVLGVTDVALPVNLEAAEPPEARGLRRDEVRLLVSDIETDSIAHTRFCDLPRWLSAGDLLVVNTSATLNAALSATTAAGESFELHLSTQLPGGFWTVEIREPGAGASLPYRHAGAGTTFRLPDAGQATLLAPYPFVASLESTSRLWIAALELPETVPSYLDRWGFPIRYRYVKGAWPSEMYQTVFATEPGSAEMPSAGRPFTPELLNRLRLSGIQIAPILLHTGVASLEDHEPPYEEFYRVSRDTAERVNATRRSGHRVVAVGTTVVRALETVTDECGSVPGHGWTDLVITPDRPIRSVDALITGLHEPQATHMMMLEGVIIAAAHPGATSAAPTICAACHLRRAYAEARQEGYLWHEFGDSHLIIGARLRGRDLGSPTAEGTDDARKNRWADPAHAADRIP